MKVLAAYTSYPLSETDWRGRFMADMVTALSARTDIDLRVWGPPGPVPAAAKCVASEQEARWLRRLLEQGGIAHLLTRHPARGTLAAGRLMRYLRAAYRRNTDVAVAHVHWLQNALPLWGSDLPAVISVLGTDFRLLSLPGMGFALRRAIGRRRCIIAPNAHWMVPALERQFGDLAEIRAVPFGVDAKWYSVSRNPAGPQPRKWLVVLRVTPRKMGRLFEWGQGLFDDSDQLHLLGPMQEQVEMPPWVHYHGPVDPETLMRKWYPDITGMVTLSEHSEGRPQVILEAMACGIPVIASDIAAHRDVIQSGRTGYLVSSQNDLASALKQLSTTDINLEVGRAAKEWVGREIGTWDDCAERYVQAYRRVAEDPGQ
ncbi:MAG: glycosyltransferase family 4 protein [Gammaproteobacteria bacterium]